MSDDAKLSDSTVLDWETGKSKYDDSRESLTGRNLGEFDAILKSRIAETVLTVRGDFEMGEFSLHHVELELAAHGDGGHFHSHTDTIHEKDAGRVMTAVYYFFAEPRRFSGGELRLCGWWRGDAKGEFPPPHRYITPESDGLLIFPSWAVHEVMPVVCPSGEFADSRFSVNCWVWRQLPEEA
jgi:Rps23 Pro-64 3,4-dihydroxylase Tpa1-like proline 4-hydroxylase